MDAMLVTNNGRKFIQLEQTTSKDRLMEIRKWIGCERVDAIHISDELVGWVDDEGLMKAGNTIQTIVYVKDDEVVYGNQIAGNIVITSHKDGETLGLTEELKKDLNINLRVVI